MTQDMTKSFKFNIKGVVGEYLYQYNGVGQHAVITTSRGETVNVSVEAARDFIKSGYYIILPTNENTISSENAAFLDNWLQESNKAKQNVLDVIKQAIEDTDGALTVFIGKDGYDVYHNDMIPDGLRISTDEELLDKLPTIVKMHLILFSDEKYVVF